MLSRPSRLRSAVALGALLAAGLLFGQGRGFRSAPEIAPDFPKEGEFHFLRVEYVDMYGIRGGFGGYGRGWWMQDWPEGDMHFSQGLKRLTRVDVGEERHTPLTDDRIFEYPWIYATQVGYWNLNDQETARLQGMNVRSLMSYSTCSMGCAGSRSSTGWPG